MIQYYRAFISFMPQSLNIESGVQYPMLNALFLIALSSLGAIAIDVDNYA